MELAAHAPQLTHDLAALPAQAAHGAIVRVRVRPRPPHTEGNGRHPIAAMRHMLMSWAQGQEPDVSSRSGRRVPFMDSDPQDMKLLLPC